MEVKNCCQYDMQSKKLTEEEDCPAELKDNIKTIAKNEGFTKYDVKIKKIPVDGGNYMAELYEIDIIGSTNDGNKEINTFVKHLNLESGGLSQFVDIPEIYKTEKFAYKELGNVFNEIQEDAKVPVEERYKMVKYFESNPTAIVMENIRKQGYRLYSRNDTVSLDYAMLAIKNLAKFHALSFIIERSKPDFFDNEIKTLNSSVIFNKEWYEYQNSMFSLAMNTLECDLRNRVKNSIFNKLDAIRKQRESPERICLCHGDYRVMNLMIREADGEIKDIIALDYQILIYGNPLSDFIYFIFTSTDKKFRKNHLSHIKETYYETLQYFLNYFNVDVEEIFPRKYYEKLYTEMLDYGLATMVIVGPLMFADEADAPDLSNVTGLDFKVHDIYKDLLTDVIEDFIEWGHL